MLGGWAGCRCGFCKYPAWIDAIRLATIQGEQNPVSYWQHDGEVYRLNEYEPVQFDVYGVPLGARWECSSANWPTLLELLSA